jgi:threonine aldolase
MIFASDNWAGVSDRVAEAIGRAGSGFAPAHGNDELTKKVEARFAEIFEHEVAVFFVATGTAANMLALTAFSRPGGVVFCHEGAHVVDDESGAPEFQAGCRLGPIPGPNGKLTPAGLEKALAHFSSGAVYHGQPMAVTVSQLTELGTAYSSDEIAGIAGVAHDAGLTVHMDGARFASAVAALGVAPAEVTWRAGVDVLSFGGTKGGCWAAEAAVFFDKAQAAHFPFIRKRAGHLFSKSRFVAAQFEAYLADGHWLELAKTANERARRLSRGIEESGHARLVVPADANEVFVVIPMERARVLRAAGAIFHDWNPAIVGSDLGIAPDEVLVRLVTSFTTSHEEVERFLELLG